MRSPPPPPSADNVDYSLEPGPNSTRGAFAWRVAGDYLVYLKASLKKHSEVSQGGRKGCVQLDNMEHLLAPRQRCAPASESQDY